MSFRMSYDTMEEQNINGNHMINGNPNDESSLSKKDKKRQQITTKLTKMNEMFVQEKDNYYRTMLHGLQNTLTSLHNNTNEVYLNKIKDHEEERDYGLTRLRLWEEYQVTRMINEFNHDRSEATSAKEGNIKLVKEKLYERLTKKIKKLKENKLLTNVANSNSYNITNSITSTGSINLYDRRSLRKREFGHHSNHLHNMDTQDEFSDSASGYTSASKKRKKTTDYSSSGGGHSTSDTHSKNRSHSSINDDSNLSDDDYDALHDLIFGEKQEKPLTRHSTKAFSGLNGLKNDEISDDLNLLRGALRRGEKKP